MGPPSPQAQVFPSEDHTPESIARGAWTPAASRRATSRGSTHQPEPLFDFDFDVAAAVVAAAAVEVAATLALESGFAFVSPQAERDRAATAAKRRASFVIGGGNYTPGYGTSNRTRSDRS